MPHDDKDAYPLLVYIESQRSVTLISEARHIPMNTSIIVLKKGASSGDIELVNRARELNLTPPPIELPG